MSIKSFSTLQLEFKFDPINRIIFITRRRCESNHLHCKSTSIESFSLQVDDHVNRIIYITSRRSGCQSNHFYYKSFNEKTCNENTCIVMIRLASGLKMSDFISTLRLASLYYLIIMGGPECLHYTCSGLIIYYHVKGLHSMNTWLQLIASGCNRFIISTDCNQLPIIPLLGCEQLQLVDNF
jgi:hypothetical protein